MNFLEGVRKFNLAAGRTEDVFDPRMVAFHVGMQLEELAETLNALALDPLADWHVIQTAKEMANLGLQFKRGNLDRCAAGANRVELLDGCIDVMVVSAGNIMSQGVDMIGATNEVNRSNLAKLVDGRAIKDGNGKIQKPPGWTPPNLQPFVK